MYGRLEEPDGLTGLMKLRSGGPKLQDQILAAEKAGCWTDALALHEHQLQSDGEEQGPPGLSVGQRGRLQCLLHMGHLKGMLAEVGGWSLGADGDIRIPYLQASQLTIVQLPHYDGRSADKA